MCVSCVCVRVCDRDREMEEKGGKKKEREVGEEEIGERRQESDSFFHQRI